ncbi:BTAD domain-containing putative transcriptional regulator [Lentzea cavernae]|uniref:SARP family transcriptional regulator n=1 Tax=Lentzea cavernae TaxID=2020703 RepID=A0ABQ3MUE4_9PSEU|nr:BTAD domain-containing putative transcriptional regulator [Lentzea cavernae]GHH59216.1 SARP family transcriptional regulator [Lentzea cavernae]
MRVNVLGPLQVVAADGALLEVRGKRLRWLLIRLAVEPGHVVGADRLIADLWRGEPPVDGPAALQSLVSRLRRVLGAAAVSSHASGYRLEASTDVEEFARTRDAALWRGAAFEEAPFAVDEAVRLALLRDDLAGLEALAAAHPLREDVQARLMLALNAAGRRSDALAVFARVRSALADELGVDPGEALAAAHLAVLRERVARGNLPAPVGSFVGRDADLAALAGLLRDNRLVTLTGFGGVGKTRLALTHAATVPQAWFAELDSTAEPLAALDSALGPNPLAAPVFSRLGTSLVVLDNCEHVVDAAAALCVRLLAEAPDARVLATSREPLGIPGEVVHPVAPLDLDHAVRLFSSRVGSALDADVVRRVCAALDGIPLALELAAARARSLSAAQLESRVDSRLRLLDRGARTGPARHRTLRAVIDWSWELLDDAERVLLARLAVFVGGATAEAVHFVCGAGDLWDTEDLLAALVEKSLVVRAGERYRLLETVREYALEQNDVDPARHAACYVELAERNEPLLRGPRQLEALHLFDVERGNLDAVMAWAVRNDLAVARRMMAARTWHWLVMTKRFEEIHRWALQVPGDPLSEAVVSFGTAEVADGLKRLWQEDAPMALCALMLTSGQVWGAPELGERLGVLADRLERSPDAWMRAFSALVRGLVAGEFSEGAAPRAEEAYLRALEGFRAVGDRWAVVFGLSCLVMVLINRGAFAEGFRAVSEARQVAAELGEPESVLVPMSVLVQAARLKIRTGDLAGARDDLARVPWSPFDLDQGRIAQAHGEVAYWGGDFEDAVRFYRQALDATVDSPASQFRANVHAGLGLALTRLGHLGAAGEEHGKALDAVSKSADGPARATVLEWYADWLLAQGDPGSAGNALDEAERLRGGPSSDPAVVQLRDRVRAEVGVDR